MTWWSVLLSVLGGLVLLWLALLAALWWASRRGADTVSLREALRLVPDVVRLLRRLVADPTVPRGVRIWLTALLVYLLSPIDLIPDFIPVLGYADDAIIVAVVLRFATKHAGAEALARHWPGTPQGLQALRTLAGLPGDSA
jgi:uncharacterized membrane protein YkvA (DUF1232 family)